jgi:competence protein ComEC
LSGAGRSAAPGWRAAAIAGVAAGLALSPLAGRTGGEPALAALALAAAVVAGHRPLRAGPRLLWLALVAMLCACAGLLAGAARLRAIDDGAYQAPVGSRVAIHGHVAAVPRRSRGIVRVQVETSGGRLLVEASEPLPNLPVGAELAARGVVAEPPQFYRAYLRRQGIVRVLRAAGVQLSGGRRGGPAGTIDAMRMRAEHALGRGMPAREAALARGFVLGEDDRIDPRTAEDFRRSGLAHLLAVSGQNVVLLALLGSPMLALLGIPLRQRLLWLLALVAVYVPLAGAGPSIQRAGVMGAASLAATLAGRPADRAYALLLAVTVTLAINPRASGDVGWQLSFAAVCGIFALAAPLRELLARHLGAGRWSRPLAEGLAVTIAATLATAPLMAHHFGSLSLTTLVANLLALPAVAPAMWLGMLAAAAGQIPALPVEPLNWLDSLLLAYIAQVAETLGRPGWALASLPLRGWAPVALAYAATAAAAALLRRRAGARAAARKLRPRKRLLLAISLAGAALLGTLALASAGPPRGLVAGIRVSVLDVGQGDAILLQPANGDAVLVDGGPPGAGLGDELRRLGVASLGAAVVTHDQSDHAGGIAELLGTMPVRRLVYAEAGPHLLAQAAAAGARPTRLAEGGELRSGGLRLEALWPPRELVAPARPAGGTAVGTDPNARSLVLLARWRRFEMLLTGDAEAEAVPIDPGPLDVLKLSHHGSADAGLAELLDRSAPGLAVVSVGAHNPFGHPDPATLAALAQHHVPILRTDRDGTVTIEVARGHATVDTAK